jgi:predicted lysophospholipase L1 biosynthesis ABC-type transport system permease subunit
VYVVVLVSALVLTLPLVALLPVHPPEAVQAVALLEDQVNIDVPPLDTLVGLALSVTLGGLATATVTDWDPEPPVPVQVRV